MSAGRTLADACANAGRSALNAALSLAPPAEWVLLEVNGHLPERDEPLPLTQRVLRMARPDLSLAALADHLHRAGADPRLKGVVLRFAGLHLSTTKAWSLRALLTRLQREGKQVVVWLDHLDAQSYLVATAADRIAAPEGAELEVRGLRLEVSFLKDLLDRCGVAFDVETMGEYKSAADHLRHSRMSAPQREMLEALVDSLWGDLVGAIADGRRLTEPTVRALIDQAPMPARHAMDHGLIDGVLYEDELPAWLGGGDPVRLVPWDRARGLLTRPLRRRADRAIALVPLVGTIIPGQSRRLPVPLPLMGTQAGAETVVKALRAAARDRTVGAIVLLIDSPGGSALASEQIWREVTRVGRHLPVVAWMGDVAASGGYYAAAAARSIMAQPSTLTGSIGVIAAKTVLAGLRERLGVHLEAVSRGRMAGLFTTDHPFDDEEREQVRAMLRRTYDRFKWHVAEGRRMDLDTVEEVARGRVWTGRQALERGLVDGLGGLDAAIEKAKELAGLPADREADVHVVHGGRGPLVPPHPAAALAELPGAWDALQQDTALALMPWGLL
ncbi:MAG: signal peptide peptidase SppA [Myxococcales bacterium]